MIHFLLKCSRYSGFQGTFLSFQAGEGTTSFSCHFVHQCPRLQICPLYIFGNYPPQMVPRDLNIAFQGLAAWFRGQIYNPDVIWYIIFHLEFQPTSGEPFRSNGYKKLTFFPVSPPQKMIPQIVFVWNRWLPLKYGHLYIFWYLQSQLMDNCWFGAGGLDSWNPPMKGIGILGCTLRIPNH